MWRSNMSHLYSCEDQLCREDLDLHSLGETIEHLRKKHRLSFIRRPGSLGTSDSHGHVWYCFDCETKAGKNHRSFQSNKAMWDHLNDHHNHQLDNIKLEIWATGGPSTQSLVEATSQLLRSSTRKRLLSSNTPYTLQRMAEVARNIVRSSSLTLGPKH
jgi:hypothetical protein